MAVFYPRNPQEHRAVAKWASGKIRDNPDFGEDVVCIAIIRNGKIKCAAIFHHYIGDDIFIHLAAEDPSWATPESICAILEYPFMTAKVRRLTAIVHPHNKAVRKLAEGVGFEREGSLRDSFYSERHGFQNAQIYGFTRRDFEKSKWHARLMRREASKPPEMPPLGLIRATG